MAKALINSNRYTIESLYQWDLNQVLKIYGLSLPSTPEIHFTNDAMDKAIVKQATMNSAGIITVDIPNSLLQKPYKIMVYVCIYDGDTFESLYKLEIPVKARSKPADYTIEDSYGEIYSFKALENKVNEVLRVSLTRYDDTVKNLNDAINRYKDAETLRNETNSLLSECEKRNNEFENWKDTVDKSLDITRGILKAGETEVTIEDSRITTNSAFDLYTSVFGVNPIDISVTTGSITLTFEVRITDLEVGVRVHE